MIVLPKGIGLEKLLEAGGEITVKRDPSSGEDYIDLNTGMKSHLHLYWRDGEWLGCGRYDIEYFITSEEELFQAVECCLCGREYMHSAWQTLLVQEGVLREKVEKNVTLFFNGTQLTS